MFYLYGNVLYALITCILCLYDSLVYSDIMSCQNENVLNTFSSSFMYLLIKIILRDKRNYRHEEWATLRSTIFH